VNASSLPAALEYRLRPAETVLGWGRPGRIAIAGRSDLATLQIGGFWAGGFRAVPLEMLRDVVVDASN
jgi:hypothetical protein